MPAALTRDEIEALGLNEESKRKLFRDNAIRIYKLDGGADAKAVKPRRAKAGKG